MRLSTCRKVREDAAIARRGRVKRVKVFQRRHLRR
jgi:hypothetical protein